MFSEQELSELRMIVSERLGEKRFRHTLGVERMAIILAERLIPDRIPEIRAAALLHDITKELSDREHMEIMNKLDYLTDSDFLSKSVYHSITAPFVIMCEFTEFATDDVLSAVENHTTGSPEMSLFDEIIFISDYIEEGRSYPSCVSVREALLLALRNSEKAEDIEPALHDATVKALENTIISVIERKQFLHEKTVKTRNAFLGRRPMPLD